MTTLPRTRLEWMLAVFFALLLAVGLYGCLSALLGIAGIIRPPAWVGWLTQRQHLTAAGIALAVGLWLMFRRAVKD